MIEGFLSDLRSDRKAGRSVGPAGRKDAQQSKSVSTEKSSKARGKQASTSTKPAGAVTASPTTTPTSKLPGKLNAAHASPTARLNAFPNSSVGKIATYEQALVGKTPSLADAAKALASLTSKELTVENIDALNAMLGIEDVKAEDILGALDEVRNPTEQLTETVENPPTNEPLAPATEVVVNPPADETPPSTTETVETPTDEATTSTGTTQLDSLDTPDAGSTTTASSTGTPSVSLNR